MSRLIRNLRTNPSWHYWLFIALYLALFIFYFFVLKPRYLDFKFPQALVATPQGTVYLAYPDKTSIQKFDATGALVQSFGSKGSGNAQFSPDYNSLFGMAFDSQGFLYISDAGNGRIQKFDSQGQFVTSWPIPRLSSDELCRFCRLATDSQDNIYLTGAASGFVLKFDKTGRMVESWSREGNADGEFKAANGIAVDSRDRVYVSDMLNRRVQVFDSQGQFLAKWDITPTHSGNLDRGVLVIDREDNLYITFEYEIQKFDSQGKLLTVWQPKGKKGESDFLKSIAFDSTGKLYLLVNRGGSSQLQKFDTTGRFLEQWSTDVPGWYSLASFAVLLFSFQLGNFLLIIGQRRKEMYQGDAKLGRGAIDNPASATVTTNLNDPAQSLQNSTSPETKLKKRTREILTGLGLLVIAIFLPFLLPLVLGFLPQVACSLLVLVITAGVALSGIILILPKTEAKVTAEEKKIQEANATVGELLPILPFDYQPIPYPNYKGLVGTSYTILLSAILFLIVLPVLPGDVLNNGTNAVNILLTELPEWLVAVLVALVNWLVLVLVPLSFFIRGRLKRDVLALRWQDVASMALRLASWLGLFLLVKLISNLTIVFWIINLILLFAGGFMLLYWWVKAAWNKGDYQTALRRANCVRHLTFDSLLFRSLQVTTLLMAGDYNAAKQLIRENLGLTRDKSIAAQVINFEQAALLLAAQGHYYEAIRLLEAVIKLYPAGGSSYNNLAEIYLRQNLQPQRALELTEQAKKNRQKAFSTRILEPHVWGETLANHAWALAVNGKQAEAEKTLAQAFKQTDHRLLPGLADLHYRAGEIRRLQADHIQATVEFKKACELERVMDYGQDGEAKH